MKYQYEVRWYEFNLTHQQSLQFFTRAGAVFYKWYLEHFEGAIAKIYEL